MTAFARTSNLEMIRCKQSCEHVLGSYRSAILLVDEKQTIQFRLVRCNVCTTEGARITNPREQKGATV